MNAPLPGHVLPPVSPRLLPAAMLGALQQRFVDIFCERLQNAMDRHRAGNHHARLKAWVETGLETYLDNVALHDVVFHEYRPEDRRMRNDNAVITQLVGLLKEGCLLYTSPSPRD